MNKYVTKCSGEIQNVRLVGFKVPQPPEDTSNAGNHKQDAKSRQKAAMRFVVGHAVRCKQLQAPTLCGLPPLEILRSAEPFLRKILLAAAGSIYY